MSEQNMTDETSLPADAAALLQVANTAAALDRAQEERFSARDALRGKMGALRETYITAIAAGDREEARATLERLDGLARESQVWTDLIAYAEVGRFTALADTLGAALAGPNAPAQLAEAHAETLEGRQLAEQAWSRRAAEIRGGPDA